MKVQMPMRGGDIGRHDSHERNRTEDNGKNNGNEISGGFHERLSLGWTMESTLKSGAPACAPMRRSAENKARVAFLERQRKRRQSIGVFY
jgi:hypothetical protein